MDAILFQVAMKKRVEDGEKTTDDFFKEFCKVFGNPHDPTNKVAQKGQGHNYITTMEEHREQMTQSLVQHLSMRSLGKSYIHE